MAYGYLSSEEQWQLHDFFKPTKDWPDDEALAHRQQITQQRPTLPHQAGRALAKLDEIAARVTVSRVRANHQAATQKTSGKHSNVRNRDRQIQVLGVVNPEIDTKRLARAIVMLAEQLAAGEQREAEGRITDDDLDHRDLAAS